MLLSLETERARSIEAVRERMAGREPVDFRIVERREARRVAGRAPRRPDHAGPGEGSRRVVETMTLVSGSAGQRVSGSG